MICSGSEKMFPLLLVMYASGGMAVPGAGSVSMALELARQTLYVGHLVITGERALAIHTLPISTDSLAKVRQPLALSLNFCSYPSDYRFHLCLLGALFL